MSSASFRALAKRAAALYPTHDRFARHFAYGKLTGDPAFEHLLRDALIPKDARIVDLGSGQGVLASLLGAAHADGDANPRPRGYHGIELMAKDVARASAAHAAMRALAPSFAATTVQGDIREAAFPPSDCVVILDVLHYIDEAAQSQVLRRVRESLAGGGVLLLRVGDAARTWRFRYTVAVDRLVMALRGHRLERLWCRPLAAWVRELESLGFAVQSRPMSEGTAFANVLLVARYDPR